MSIYVSTLCLSREYDLPTTLDIYSKLGITNVELGLCKGYKDLNIIKEHNFKYIVHNYFPPPEEPIVINLASQDTQICEESIIQIKKSIDFCANSSINFFSFHTGFRIDPDINFKFNPYNIPEYETSFNTFKESVAEIADYAETSGVKVAIENNALSEYNLINGENKLLLMCELWEFERLINEIKSANLGILLDIGHLKLTSNLLKYDANEFINKLKDKIFAVHVHENNGRVDEHRCTKEGDWSFAILNRYFKNSDMPVILEGFINGSCEKLLVH